MAIQQTRGNMIVAIAEDSSGDGDKVAERALGWIAARVHLRLDLFNDDAAATLSGLHAASKSSVRVPPYTVCSGEFFKSLR
jgi:hypothetical protein